MFSVSLDVFSMPGEMWEGVAYDAFCYVLTAILGGRW